MSSIRARFGAGSSVGESDVDIALGGAAVVINNANQVDAVRLGRPGDGSVGHLGVGDQGGAVKPEYALHIRLSAGFERNGLGAGLGAQGVGYAP